jgi:hypothetical protein
MFAQDVTVDAQVWRHRAAALAAKLNFHHWLSRLVPKFFFLLVVASLGEILRRQMGATPRFVAAFLVVGAAVVVSWAWLEARRHFCTRVQALVRLETVLGLHNRLSCAADGVVPWPRTTNEPLSDGYDPNWKQIFVPALAGILFLYAAHLVPVHHVSAAAGSGTISPPPDFAQIQSWINTLKAADLVEPAKLDEMQSSLDKLRQRSPQDWYTQSSLEAADSLKELMEQSMNSLESNLDSADQSVEAMQDQQGNSNSGEGSGLRAMQDQLSQAGNNLASGNFPLKKELADAMKGAASSDKQLSASQLAALQKKLEQGKAACQTASNCNGGFGQEMQQALDGAAGHGLARRRMAPAPGGLGGGKETAPLVLQARDKTTPQGAMTGVNNDDMSRVSLGDTIKVTASKPTVDPNAYQGTGAGGAAHVTGNGGEAVWRSTYDPQEADVLSRFFQ